MSVFDKTQDEVVQRVKMFREEFERKFGAKPDMKLVEMMVKEKLMQLQADFIRSYLLDETMDTVLKLDKVVTVAAATEQPSKAMQKIAEGKGKNR